MSIDNQYKAYAVKVNIGSGCIVQPSSNEYSYVITAKHNVLPNIENNTLPQVSTTNEIPIEANQIYTHPNPDIDLAIIKIAYQENIELIIKPNVKDYSTLYLYGFPENKSQDDYKAKKAIAQLIEKNPPFYVLSSKSFSTQDDVVGFSGCGVFQEIDDIIYLSGIEFRMDSYNDEEARINIYPIDLIEEIIQNYIDQLEKAQPIYMNNFSFLRDDSFRLEVDALDEERIEATRNTLRNKALNIIQSDITPYGIKELFKERILLDDKCSEHLSTRNIWVAWLEFLTIMNIIKYENIESSSLTEIFNAFRLKYSNKDDWTDLIKNDLLNSDYLGLAVDSTIIVSTKKAPKNNFKLPKGKLVNLVKVPDKKGMRTDNGINHPFNAFNFVHLEYFKTDCIQQRLELYENINDENELLNILRNQYNELFN